jgi:transcriptional regulator with XRE-family HTH domain
MMRERKQEKPGRPPNPPDTRTFLGRFAAAVRARRVERGLSVEQAAKKARVTASAWRDWESGAGNPPLSRLPAIAAALGVGVAELVG